MKALTHHPQRSGHAREYSPSPTSLEQEARFLEKESRFYVRLLRQCKGICHEHELPEYEEMINHFTEFQASLPSGEESPATHEFNPWNQTVTRSGQDPAAIERMQAARERFNDLKERAFHKVGRFFSIRIR